MQDPFATPSGTSKAQAYSYSDCKRQRQMTLGDLLLENRIVFLQGEIHTGNANEVVMKLLRSQSENRRKDVHFYINSPGGDVVATLAIYDVMQILSCPVATYRVGSGSEWCSRTSCRWHQGETLCSIPFAGDDAPALWWGGRSGQ